MTGKDRRPKRRTAGSTNRFHSSPLIFFASSPDSRIGEAGHPHADRDFLRTPCFPPGIRVVFHAEISDLRRWLFRISRCHEARWYHRDRQAKGSTVPPQMLTAPTDSEENVLITSGSGGGMQKSAFYAIVGISLIVTAVSLGYSASRYLSLRYYAPPPPPPHGEEAASVARATNIAPEQWTNIFAPSGGMNIPSRLAGKDAGPASGPATAYVFSGRFPPTPRTPGAPFSGRRG